LRVGLRQPFLQGLALVLIVAEACLFQSLVPAAAWGQTAKAPRTRAEKSAPAQTPVAVPTQVEVARGDTLFRIAGKVRYPGVTLNQMVLALFRANPEAFFAGNIHQLIVGRVLKVPPPDAVTAVDAAQASQQLKALVAQPVVPVPPPAPPAKEAPVPAKPAEPPAKPAVSAPSLAPAQAARHFEEGIKFERDGDLQSALTAYLVAAEAGNGPAQKRLGDIYNTGNAIVQRDYETALKWYQKARAQGVEIPKPITNPGGTRP
jgi:FimV-like protein